VPLTIYAECGDDVFNVRLLTTSDFPNLTLDGGPGSDTVKVFYNTTGGAVGQQQTLADGTVEFDISPPFNPGLIQSRIRIPNVEQIFSDLGGSA
jgi:hypothetical protein